MIIRSATSADLDWIALDLLEFEKEGAIERPLSGPDSKTALLSLIENHLVLVAEIEGVGPVGFVAGCVAPSLFNSETKVLSELFWWVKPKYRFCRAAQKLLDAFIEWGEKNADLMSFSLARTTHLEPKVLLDRGFHAQETLFLRKGR